MNEDMKYIVSRIIERAYESIKEHRQAEEDQFKNGRSVAYYEVLDIIKSELDAHGCDLKEYGLDVNLEKEFL
jgi:hypothetical protein